MGLVLPQLRGFCQHNNNKEYNSKKVMQINKYQALTCIKRRRCTQLRNVKVLET